MYFKSISRKNAPGKGIIFLVSPKTLFFIIKWPKYESKVPQKPHILTQLGEINRLAHNFTIFGKKYFRKNLSLFTKQRTKFTLFDFFSQKHSK